jgi:hypothetical protein
MIWRAVICEDPSDPVEVMVGLICYAVKPNPRYGYFPNPDRYAVFKGAKYIYIYCIFGLENLAGRFYKHEGWETPDAISVVPL